MVGRDLNFSKQTRFILKHFISDRNTRKLVTVFYYYVETVLAKIEHTCILPLM